MGFCRIVDYLIRALPGRIFQEALIRLHVERCPRCESGLASREMARRCLNQEIDIEADPAFVRKVLAKAARGTSPGESRRTRIRPSSRWAYAAAALVIGLGAVFWFFEGRKDGPGRNIGTTVKFRINYLNVDGTPADALVIQPRGSDLVIIWADRDSRDGEPGGQP
jgi:hypothetical protein